MTESYLNILSLYLNTGTFTSRLKLSSQGILPHLTRKLLEEISNECRNVEHDLEFTMSEHSSLDYHLVRYEDVAFKPLYYARRLHEVLSFKYLEEVERWIKKSTTTRDHRQLRNRWGTMRNSTVTPYTWVKYLPLRYVEQIEKRCGIMMDMLGYRRVATVKGDFMNSNITYHSIISTVINELNEFLVS